VPNILVVGGGGQTLEGLAAQLMGVLQSRQEKEPAGFTPAQPAAPDKPKTTDAPEKKPPPSKG